MNNLDNKEKIKKITEDIIDDACIEMKKKINKALNSGGLDVSSWDEHNGPMIIPKIIVIALLETEALQYMGRGTSFEKHVKKSVKNLKYFL